MANLKLKSIARHLPPDCFRIDLLMPPGVYENGRVKKGFETVAECKGENDLRLHRCWRTLTAQRPRSRHHALNRAWVCARTSPELAAIRLRDDRLVSLINRLKAAQVGKVAHTLASSVYFREQRLLNIGGLLELLDRYGNNELRVFTIINVNWRVNAPTLAKLRAGKLTRQLRTHLERAGVNAIPGLLVAYLHAEFDPISGLFQLHFHGVATARKAAALTGLVRKPDGSPRSWGYVQTCTGSVPVHTQRVRDRPRQFSYLLKPYWPSRRIVIGADGVARRDKRPTRIAEPIHSLVALWLDRESVADLRVLTGCRPLAHGRLRLGYTVFDRTAAVARTRRSMPSKAPSRPSAKVLAHHRRRRHDNTAVCP